MIDWEKIRLDYITHSYGYKKLAEKYGVSFSMLCKKAAKDGWYKSKQEYRREQIENAADNIIKKEALKLADLQKAADGMGAVIKSVISDTQQFKRHIVKEGVGSGESRVEERVFEKYDTRAIKDITTSIKDLTAAVRNLYGLLTEPERSAMDIAAARLVLDQKKANEGTPDDTSTGVVQIADVIVQEEISDKLSN